MRRYSRHLLIPEVGLSGQERLGRARVLCVGAGGLGSPVLSYLAAAGVGRIGVMDDDVVDETNLQRQTLFTMKDIGRSKADAAAARLQSANPSIFIDAIQRRFEARNARELVRLYDVVVDCTDTFASRYAINDACVLEKKPNVYGSIFRFDGQVSVFSAAGPCYRCLFPHPPPPGSVPSCAEGGVLGALAGIVGTLQASEVLKLLLQIGDPLRGRLLLVDALGARLREFALERDPACVVCSDGATLREVHDLVLPSGSGFAQVEPEQLAELRNVILLDVREPHEAALGEVLGSLHIPASELAARLHELDTANTYVVACRIGVKSRWAMHRLADAGFRNLYHLRGGLLAYAALHKDFDFF